MTKDLWINLPVKNVLKSSEFFNKIGFKKNEKYPDNEQSASFLIGEKPIVLMLFAEDSFRNFTQHQVADTSKGTEVLFSFDAESREEINELAQKVENAGGKLFAKPQETQGWMYGFGFSDLDGHRWNAVHMNFSKMPKH